jgi:hypothetical protein
MQDSFSTKQKELQDVESFFMSDEIKNIVLENIGLEKESVFSKISFNNNVFYNCHIKSYSKKSEEIKVKLFCNESVFKSVICDNIEKIEFFNDKEFLRAYNFSEKETYNVKFNKKEKDNYILEVKFRSE